MLGSSCDLVCARFSCESVFTIHVGLFAFWYIRNSRLNMFNMTQKQNNKNNVVLQIFFPFPGNEFHPPQCSSIIPLFSCKVFV